MNALEAFEKGQQAKLTENKNIPDFQAGDTVRVNVRIVEGNKERVQAFEGVCIARKNRGINSSFTVRKISHGEGVERVFPLYSPRIESVKLVRRGDVRRAKLYYMRGLSGKAARIREKRDTVTNLQDVRNSKAAANAPAENLNNNEEKQQKAAAAGNK